VSALVEHNLLRQRDGPDGEPRFTMLETIREYALDRLREPDSVRETHANHFLALAEAAAVASERAPVFDRLESDHANIRAALAWFRTAADTGRELRLATAMSRFWHDRGYLREGRERLEDAVARRGTLTGRALIGLCRLRVETGGSVDDTLRDATQAIAMCQEDGDDHALAEAWNLRGMALFNLGRLSAASSAAERAIAYAEAARATDEAAEAKGWLLIHAVFGPMPVERGLELCRNTRAYAGGNRALDAFSLVEGAVLEAMWGNFAHAREMLAEGRAILDDLRLRVLGANTCQEVFFVEMLAGNPKAAARALHRVCEDLAEIEETSFLSTAAGHLAHALHAAGCYEEVEHWTEVSERSAAPDDIWSQMLWRLARAKELARRGETADAERLAQDGVKFARQYESPHGLANALMDLAEVLRLTGRSGEVAPAIEEAIRLYDAKGNVVAAAAARRQLGALQPT
jgi:tetratricopeptide (TPR) repeat protein